MKVRVARMIVEALLRRLRVGQVVIVEGARRRSFGSGQPIAVVEVRSPTFWTGLLRGSRGLAGTYMNAGWESPDLPAVIELCALNMPPLDRMRGWLAPLRLPWQALVGPLRRNTRLRSRRDISAHYDLGNDLFELMLDSTMMYSCALFETPETPLEEAAVAKLEHICAKLELSPADHVLEIGTGWGGFAVHAAGRHGCRVTTTTISQEQHDYAEGRVRKAGLSDRVTVLLEDYRDLGGTYDKLVSIEMIEAVGWRDFSTFFTRCSGLLKPHGVMLLQAITIDDRAYEVEKAARSFINTYIFPNGCLPSLKVISRCVARCTDMRPVHLEDITPHYTLTLRHWRRRFEANTVVAAERGYDERFQRLWKMYLSYCEGGFSARRIADVHLVLAKPAYRGELGLIARGERSAPGVAQGALDLAS